MSLLYETVISKLGGGINFNFKPKENIVYISPVGILCGEPFEFILGIEVENEKLILPFGRKYSFFSYVEQEITLNSLTFRAKNYKLGIMLEAKFFVSFYPKDIMTSIAPFFYLDLKVSKIHTKDNKKKSIRGKVIFEIKPKNSKIILKEHHNKLFLKGEYTAKFKVNFQTGLMDYLEDPTKVFFSEIIVTSLDSKEGFKNLYFEVSDYKYFEKKFIIAMFCKDVIVVKQKTQNFYFLYNKFFNNIEEVINFAIKNEKTIRKKIEIFDSILENSSLSKTAQNFISYTFHSYIINTRWLYNKTTNEELFTVIEGNCGYHSTVDVEYNVAPFYLLFWPELLEKELKLWSEFIKNDWVPHDIGALFEIDSQVYPHNMEIEENCNYILLNFAYWRWTNKFHLIQQNYDVLKKLMEFIIKCDKNNNGFPDEATANTVDDASAAVQFSKEQVYLALKTLSAAKALEIIAEEKKDINFLIKCRKLIKKIKKTLDKKAWFKDHYIVCLDKKADGLKDVWTNRIIKGKLKGREAYSIYTSNGLFYLIISDIYPDVNFRRIKLDILSSKEKNMLEYGCSHTSEDKSNIWISQNLWHDFLGMYLGFDFSNNIERYWQFELFENTQGRGGCFVDTYGWNYLHYYPRGVCSFWILYALAGVRVDSVRKFIKFSPIKIPLKIPLVSFADWETGKVPFLEFFIKNKKIVVKILNKHLLKDYKIIF